MSNDFAVGSVTIRVNGEPRRLAGAPALDALVRDLGLADHTGLAIAVNDSVVPRAAWSARALAEGDHVLVVRATQGG